MLRSKIQEQRFKNVQTCEYCVFKMFPSSGKIFAKFCASLLQKVSYVAFLRFLVSFSGTFWNFVLLFLFLHYLGILGLLRCFVANKIFHNLCTFWVKLFLLKPCSCKKVVFLHLCIRFQFNHFYVTPSKFEDSFLKVSEA